MGRRWFPALALGALAVILILAGCATAGQTGSKQPTPTLMPTLTPTPNLTLASYAGAWTVHDEKLTINANGSGTEVWNAGPCSQTSSSSGLCEGIGGLSFQANPDGSLTGTYQSISYQSSTGQLPSGYQPSSDDPKVGDTITLKHDGAHLLAATSRGFTWEYCDPFALGNGWKQCGA